MIVEAVRLVGRLEAGEDYRKDGNEKFDTGKHAEIRRELREDAQVKTLIQKYWDVLVNDMDDPSGGIDKATYVSFFLAVSRALLQRAFWDRDECHTAVLADWERDTEGQSAPLEERLVSRAKFHNTFFETVDVWTLTTDKADYVNFLEQLFPRIFIVGNPRKTKKKARKATVEEEYSSQDDNDDDGIEEDDDFGDDKKEAEPREEAAVTNFPSQPEAASPVTEVQPSDKGDDRWHVEQQEKQADKLLGTVQRTAAAKYYILAVDIMNMRKEVREGEIESKLKSIRLKANRTHRHLLLKAQSELCAVGLTPWLFEQEAEVKELLRHRFECVASNAKQRANAKARVDRLLGGSLLKSSGDVAVLEAAKRRDTSANIIAFDDMVKKVVDDAQAGYERETAFLAEVFQTHCRGTLDDFLRGQLERFASHRKAAAEARAAAQAMAQSRFEAIYTATADGGRVIRGEQLEVELREIERDVRKLYDESTTHVAPNLKADNKRRVTAWLAGRVNELRAREAVCGSHREQAAMIARERFASLRAHISAAGGRRDQAQLSAVVQDLRVIREETVAAYLEGAAGERPNFVKLHLNALEGWISEEEQGVHAILRDLRANRRWTRVQFTKKSEAGGLPVASKTFGGAAKYIEEQWGPRRELPAINDDDDDDDDDDGNDDDGNDDDDDDDGNDDDEGNRDGGGERGEKDVIFGDEEGRSKGVLPGFARRQAMQGSSSPLAPSPLVRRLDGHEDTRSATCHSEMQQQHHNHSGGAKGNVATTSTAADALRSGLPPAAGRGGKLATGSAPVGGSIFLEAMRLRSSRLDLYDAHGQVRLQASPRPRQQKGGERQHAPGAASTNAPPALPRPPPTPVQPVGPTTAVHQRRPATVHHPFRRSRSRGWRPHTPSAPNKGGGTAVMQGPARPHLPLEQRRATTPSFERGGGRKSKERSLISAPVPMRYQRRELLVACAETQHAIVPSSAAKGFVGADVSVSLSRKAWEAAFSARSEADERFYEHRTGRRPGGQKK